MATCASFQIQMVSIMEVLTKTALTEITNLFNDASAELRLEMCRSQRENEALKSKLQVMEKELRAARGCGEGTPGRSLNIAFEVEFREAKYSMVGEEGSVAVERVFDERLSTGPAKDEQYVGLPVEKKRAVPDDLEIKYEPVGGEHDWSGSVLLSEDWLEEDPKMSQSQAVRKIAEETSCGSSGAAAAVANGGEGPLCKEEELHLQPCPAGDSEKGLLAKLKQDPEGERLDHALPLLGSLDLGLELPSGMVSEEHGWRGGSAPYEVSFDTSAESAGALPRPSRDRRTKSATARRNSSPERNASAAQCAIRPVPLCVLEHHQGVHAGEKCFLCKLCEKLFDGGDSLKQHHLTHHGGKRFSCTLCGKGFTTKTKLKIHQRVHTGEKPHSCDKCGKSFAQLRNLKTHQSVHTGEKPHSCYDCGKSFAQLSNLKTHQSVHTGEKPHSCDKCGKSFVQLINLKTHQSVHTGEKPHCCDECGKSFAHLHHLKSHQRVHTGEKPFICWLCGRGFSQNHVLQRHIRSHNKV